ncbi:MAG: ribbon-helix-helix domain-containing protein [Anaerolineae bacterium]|nr:ribbon-helix-helix protein, CopG family [Anaerolineae bacterium]
MGTVTISVRAEDAERLQEMARRENQSVEDVLHDLIEQHTTETAPSNEEANTEDKLLALAALAEKENWGTEEPIDYRTVMRSEFPQYLSRRMSEDVDDSDTTG